MSDLAWGVLSAIALAGLAAMFVIVFIWCAVLGAWWSCAVLAAMAVILVVVMLRAD